MRPRAKEWDEDFGEPIGGAACAFFCELAQAVVEGLKPSCPQPWKLFVARRCHETGEGSGVFEREWSKATVRWDCAKGHGEIVPKA